MILSILICTIPERSKSLDKLVNELRRQIDFGGYPAEIVTQDDPRGVPIGTKRNKLIERSIGKYTVFIDDDDFVDCDYIRLIFNSLQHEPDCVGIIGRMFLNGNNLLLFHHSMKYLTYATNSIMEKPAGHLNPIKRSITSKFRFIEENKSEDTDFALQMVKAKAINSECFIEEKPIYFYNYVDSKPPSGIYIPKPPNLTRPIIKKEVSVVSRKKYEL